MLQKEPVPHTFVFKISSKGEIMIKISFSYPYTENARFDHDYYQQTHMKLVSDRLSPMGLIQYGIETGLSGGAPGTNPIYTATGYIIFNTQQEFQAVMEAHGEEILKDIPNFTDINPVVNVSNISEWKCT